MLYSVIMAGGSGTRFWPESRALRPKQLLNLLDEKSLIQATVDRLGDLVPAERILIVTNQRLVEEIAKQLPDLPASAIIGEPCKRDTAPCIGLAALLVSRDDPDATMVVMPADHIISPTDSFVAALRDAVSLVDSQPQRIVTFGIKPTYPAESFGYIQRGQKVTQFDGDINIQGVYNVLQFREKPQSDVAKEYLSSGNYYWNAGIFVWKAKVILEALAEHQAEMFAHLQSISDAMGTPEFQQVLEREFTAIKGTSIDYAVMEHASDIMVIEAPYQWDDAGNWQSLARLRGQDEHGNTIMGKNLTLETHDSIIRSDENHLVVTVGMKDCIVVHTPDATLVANKHDEESLRKIVEILAERGWKEYL